MAAHHPVTEGQALHIEVDVGGILAVGGEVTEDPPRVFQLVVVEPLHGTAVEPHLVLCQCACLVGEDVPHLRELLIEVAGLDLHGLLVRGHLHVELHELRLEALAQLHRHEQADGHHVAQQHEVGAVHQHEVESIVVGVAGEVGVLVLVAGVQAHAGQDRDEALLEQQQHKDQLVQLLVQAGKLRDLLLEISKQLGVCAAVRGDTVGVRGVLQPAPPEDDVLQRERLGDPVEVQHSLPLHQRGVGGIPSDADRGLWPKGCRREQVTRLHNGLLGLDVGLPIQVGRLNIADPVVQGGRQHHNVRDDLAVALHLHNIPNHHLVAADRQLRAVPHHNHGCAIGLAVGAVPVVVLNRVLHRGHSQHKHQGKDRRRGDHWADPGDQCDAHVNQEVEVRDLPELLQEVQREEGQDGVLRGADKVGGEPRVAGPVAVDGDGAIDVGRGVASSRRRGNLYQPRRGAGRVVWVALLRFCGLSFPEGVPRKKIRNPNEGQVNGVAGGFGRLCTRGSLQTLHRHSRNHSVRGVRERGFGGRNQGKIKNTGGCNFRKND
eukprot:RCo007275